MFLQKFFNITLSRPEVQQHPSRGAANSFCIFLHFPAIIKNRRNQSKPFQETKGLQTFVLRWQSRKKFPVDGRYTFFELFCFVWLCFIFTNLLCVSLSSMDLPLVPIEPQTSQICYLCENYIKRKENDSNITAVGIGTIKICAEKSKTHNEILHEKFHLLVWAQNYNSMVWSKVKNALFESPKNNKLIRQSQCRRTFTNDAKITRYSHLETVFCDYVFSDTLSPLLTLKSEKYSKTTLNILFCI